MRIYRLIWQEAPSVGVTLYPIGLYIIMNVKISVLFPDEYLMHVFRHEFILFNDNPTATGSTLRKKHQTIFLLIIVQGKMCRIRIWAIFIVAQMDLVRTKLVKIVYSNKWVKLTSLHDFLNRTLRR